MKKKKLFSIIVGAVIVNVLFVSAIGAVHVDSGRGIDVNVEDSIGLVTPDIKLDDESISVDAELDNNYYVISDNLTIDLNINDTSGRDSFFLPRYLICGVIITRNIGDAGFLPLAGIIGRFVPVLSFKAVQVVDSIAGGVNDSIDIPMDYVLPRNETYEDGEELTMHVLAAGFLPGEPVGNSDIQIPFVQYKKVSLSVEYY